MATYSLRTVDAGDKAITADINANAATIQAALNSFPGGNIQTNTIAGDRIKSNSLPGSKLVNLDLDSTKLAPNSVTTTKIAALAVTEAKIANLAVATGKIALGAVGADQLATGIARVKVDTYVGNTESAHTITGVGFTPIMLFVVRINGGTEAALRMASMTGSNNLATGGAMSSGILSLDADGFTVGTNTRVNSSGLTYCYIAIGTT